jgi:Tol biopolymer transport system component
MMSSRDRQIGRRQRLPFLGPDDAIIDRSEWRRLARISTGDADLAMCGPEGAMMHQRLSRCRVHVLTMLIGPLLALASCQSVTPATPTSTPASLDGPRVMPISGPVSSAPGKLLYSLMGELWTFELKTGVTGRLDWFPAQSLVGTPAVSPDGGLIAYSSYRTAQHAQEGAGIDLFVTTANGFAERLVVAHDTPGVSIGEPAWSPDGSSLYFTRRDPAGSARIERIGIDGSGRLVVSEGGHSPTTSRGGQHLAYLAADGETARQTLWVADLSGGGARLLVGAPDFQSLGDPRFSPDGAQIVFTAVGGPDIGPARPARRGPLSWIEVATVHAHGVPYDLWIVRADGTGLRRLTNIGEDSPSLAWSPDGQWIGFSGELGLYVVDVGGNQTRRMTDEGAFSGLTWIGR